MPIKRRTKKTVRTRRKASYRRKTATMKLRRQVHFFKRSATISTITASATTGGTFQNIAGGYTVSLDMLPNYNEFIDLFDQYKILGAKMSFVPNGTLVTTLNNAGGTNSYVAQRFVSAIDFDDNITPTSEAQLLEYGSCRWSKGGRAHTRYWKPKMLTNIYDGEASGPALAVTNARWIDTNYPEVPHYGLKIFCGHPVAPISIDASVTYQVYLTLYVAFKNVK